jgi:hypothetical protein
MRCGVNRPNGQNLGILETNVPFIPLNSTIAI